MYKYIILSSCLFGSFYLSSISLGLINKNLANKKIQHELTIINGLVFFVSGSIVVYNFSLLAR